MKYFPTPLTGLLIITALLAMVLTTGSADAAATGIYDYIRDITKKEFLIDTSDDLHEFMSNQNVYNIEPPITEEDVKDAMSYRSDLLCGRRGKGYPCGIAQSVRDIARREEFVNTLYRDLQLIAAGYELPITDHAIDPMYISARLPSLTHIWQSSNDWLTTPVIEKRVRSVPWYNNDDDKEIFDKIVRKIKCSLSGYDNKDRWFWRYKWGANQVKNEPLGEGGPKEDCQAWAYEYYSNGKDDDTELRMFKERECRLERLLVGDSTKGLPCLEEPMPPPLTEYLRNIVKKINPPLQEGEIVILPPYDLKLPNGGYLWARIGYNPADDEAGLVLPMPIEPLPLSRECTAPSDNPACLSGGPIVGGVYLDSPPEPAPNAKLCSMQFSKHGYLCSPLNEAYCPKAEEEDDEEEEDERVPNVITLTECNSEGLDEVSDKSESGPNACQTGGWRTNDIFFRDGGEDKPIVDTGEIDNPPQSRGDHAIDMPYHCSNCAVDIFCEGNSKSDDYIDCEKDEDSEEDAITSPKLGNGVIPICLPEEHPFNSYLLLHELIHAQQNCNQPAGIHAGGTREKCCATEAPAYKAQCNAMAEDGLFEGTNLTIEKCVAAHIHKSCSTYSTGAGDIVCADSAYTEDEINKWLTIIDLAMQYNPPPNLPTTCEDVIARAYEGISNSDVRMQSRSSMILRSLPRVCSSECVTEYQNTIGNNACYIAQCVEESLEAQRMLPGRYTYVSGDESFPWDSATKPDPMVGSILPTPSVAFSEFPSYRPALLTKELDLALCQMGGEPIKQPPYECAFDLFRQMAMGPSSIYAIGAGLISQTSEEQNATWELQTMAPNLGVRLSTELFRQYLKRAGRIFSELVDNASLILKGIGETDFPTQMCPMWTEEIVQD